MQNPAPRQRLTTRPPARPRPFPVTSPGVITVISPTLHQLREPGASDGCYLSGAPPPPTLTRITQVKPAQTYTHTHIHRQTDTQCLTRNSVKLILPGIITQADIDFQIPNFKIWVMKFKRSFKKTQCSIDRKGNHGHTLHISKHRKLEVLLIKCNMKITISIYLIFVFDGLIC